jgi:hypothetical protein
MWPANFAISPSVLFFTSGKEDQRKEKYTLIAMQRMEADSTNIFMVLSGMTYS